MKRFSSFNLTALFLMNSFLHLASPSLAAGGGSHDLMRICARIEYSYKDRDGKIVSSITKQECGGKFRQIHRENSQRKASREEACNAAWQHLPKLKQGENWINRSCKPFQQR